MEPPRDLRPRLIASEGKSPSNKPRIKIGITIRHRDTDTIEEEPKRIIGYSDPVLEKKRKEALKDLGNWYKHSPQTTYQDRGEHFLNYYHRLVVQRRPTITIASGTVMLGCDLKKLLTEVIKDNDRVYVGDIKILGGQDKE